MNDHKVFVLVPNNHRTGGIANYYRVLKKYLTKNVEYIKRGEKFKNEPKILIPFRFLFDYMKFCYKTWFRNRTVLINTSLGKGGIIRDGIYLILSSLSNKKIVFFRGWNPFFQNIVDQNLFVQFWIKRTFFTSDRIIVLSSDFKKKVLEWGYNGPVEIATTIVDEELFSEETWKNIHGHSQKFANPHILYLGNIATQKGIWEIAEALKILKSRGILNGLKITIAGGGEERKAVKEFTLDHDIPANFPGYVRGEQKINTFKKATIFIFASYHEGMPNAVLEAIAFGLPVITTPVGGISDFFEEEKMGFLLESREPEYIADKVNYLFERPALMKKISKYNYSYAKEHFYAGKVAKRIEGIIY